MIKWLGSMLLRLVGGILLLIMIIYLVQLIPAVPKATPEEIAQDHKNYCEFIGGFISISDMPANCVKEILTINQIKDEN